jgi:malate dehydrogenase (oxaloacetate-decarboxylating)
MGLSVAQEYRTLGYTVTVRLEYTNNVEMLGKVTTHIVGTGGDITSVDLVRSSRGRIVRDLTINAGDSDHG